MAAAAAVHAPSALPASVLPKLESSSSAAQRTSPGPLQAVASPPQAEKNRPPPIKLKDSNGSTFFGPLFERASHRFANKEADEGRRKSKSKTRPEYAVPEPVTFDELHKNYMPYLNRPFGTVSPSSPRARSTDPSPSAPAGRSASPRPLLVLSRIPVPPLSPPTSASSPTMPQAGTSSSLPQPRSSSLTSPSKDANRDRRANSVEYASASKDEALVSQRSASLSSPTTMGKRRPSTVVETLSRPLQTEQPIAASSGKTSARSTVSIEVKDGEKTRIMTSPLSQGVSIRLATDLRPQDVDVNFSCETRFDSSGQPSSQWVVRVTPKNKSNLFSPAEPSPQRDLFDSSYTLSSPTKKSALSPRLATPSSAPSRATSTDSQAEHLSSPDSPLTPQRPTRARRFSSSESAMVPGQYTGSSISSESSFDVPLTPRRSRDAGAGGEGDEMSRRQSYAIANRLKQANRSMSIVDIDDPMNRLAMADDELIPKSPKRFGRFISVPSPTGAFDLSRPGATAEEAEYQSLLGLAANRPSTAPSVPPMQTSSRSKASRHKATRSDSTIVASRLSGDRRRSGAHRSSRASDRDRDVLDADWSESNATTEDEDDDEVEGNAKRQARTTAGRMLSRWSDTETDLEDPEREKTSWSDVPDATEDESVYGGPSSA